MKNNFLILLFTGIFFTASSQEFTLPYQLTENIDFSSLTKDYDLKNIDELEVLDERVIEYAYDKEGAVVEFFYIHIIKYVNSEEAIDRNNKIYVSFHRVSELVAYNARVISAKKEVKLLGKDALKEGTNSDGQKVQFFAMSGVEKGGYIEYFYVVKRSPNLSGNYLSFQEKMPVAKSVFKIISPQNLVFITKSLNGYAKLIDDTTLADKNYLKAETWKIPKMENEDFGNEGRNKMKVIYQLFLNKSNGKKNPYNYGAISQRIFETIDVAPSKAETKDLEKILKNCNVRSSATDAEKIFKIEDYVKSHYEYVAGSDDRFEKIADICKLKTFNSLGSVKLMYQLYEIAGIEKEIVLSSNRYEIRFDPDFDSWAYLDEYMLFFPSVNKVLMPAATSFRLGVVPYGYINNYGLFIKKIAVGDLKTGAGKVKFIAAYPAEHTQHNMFLTASINVGMDSLDVRCKLTYTGYYAHSLQPDFDLVAKDKLKELEENIVKSINKNIHVKSVQIENKGASSLMINPLIVNSTFSSAYFIDKAGMKILLKFGDLIGPQSELYQEKDRTLPVENDYNRIYNREITFIIPDGYKIKNPDELKMNIQPFLAEGDGAGFVSTFTLSSNKIDVKIKEYYNQLTFPKSEYEKYRSVINAAANFNKIVLVLEKIK